MSLAAVLLVVGGLVALVAGGEVLGRGASGIARSLGLSPVVVGLTVVALATSAPEMAAPVDAALTGDPGLALGDVVGSSFVNVLPVPGVTALLLPVAVGRQLARSDIPFLIGVSVLTLVLSLDDAITRLDGGSSGCARSSTGRSLRRWGLATSLVAAVRRQPDLALGNVAGSCVLNLGAVLGVAGLLSPDGVTVDPSAIDVDLLSMVAVALVLLPLASTSAVISRWEGAVLVGYELGRRRSSTSVHRLCDLPARATRPCSCSDHGDERLSRLRRAAGCRPDHARHRERAPGRGVGGPRPDGAPGRQRAGRARVAAARAPFEGARVVRPAPWSMGHDPDHRGGARPAVDDARRGGTPGSHERSAHRAGGPTRDLRP